MKVNGAFFPEPIVNVNAFELGIAGNFEYDFYQWLLIWNPISGVAQRDYAVSENGNYQVVVSCESGCIDTSGVYAVNNSKIAATYFFMLLVSRYWGYGQLIFETRRLDGRGWDGRLNGKVQPMGVYLYRMEVDFTNGRQEKYEGNVTLIR